MVAVQDLEYTHCYFCGENKTSPLYSIKGFRGDPRSFSVVQCAVCSLVYINPRYSEEENLALYRDAYYANSAVDPSGKIRSFLTDKENKIKDHKIEVSYIKKYKGGGRILDVGTAAGFFLEALDGPWVKYGVDISAFALSHIKDSAVQMFHGTLLEAHYDDNYFDVIYVGHTLDRLIDMKQNIAEMKRILKKDGIILVTIPNINSLCARLFKEKFRLLYSNHLIYFSTKTLGSFLHEVGLYIQDVKYPFYRTSFFSWKELHKNIAKIILQKLCNTMHIKTNMVSPPFWGNVMSVVIGVRSA
ncbi:MAG: class I SAM-dependent methyltransferase [Proteobacteria bacterium]|nr:class I SAM-dependent methyltransferase [Pseudomonadota bacterium]